jgi:hypothetical protein
MKGQPMTDATEATRYVSECPDEAGCTDGNGTLSQDQGRPHRRGNW